MKFFNDPPRQEDYIKAAFMGIIPAAIVVMSFGTAAPIAAAVTVIGGGGGGMGLLYTANQLASSSESTVQQEEHAAEENQAPSPVDRRPSVRQADFKDDVPPKNGECCVM